MTRIIALSGSLRRAAYNTALLRAAAKLAPSGVQVEVHTLHGIALYDGDVEAAGIPAEVTALRAAICAGDGLLISTPEYNSGMPGVLKNALDWLSRPQAEGRKAFFGRPVAVVGTTPGSLGTVLAQDSMLSVLRALGCDVWFGARLAVPKANTLFDAEGHLQDDAMRQQLSSFVAGFAAHVAACRRET